MTNDLERLHAEAAALDRAAGLHMRGFSPEEIQAAAEQEHQKKFVARFVRADEVEVQPVDWLVEDWLARDSLAGLVGPSGSCKTFVAIDWACCVATATRWLGNAAAPGAVFMLAGEGRNGLRKRIEGWSKHRQVPIEGAPLYLASQLPRIDQITTTAIIDEVEALAKASGVPPALVVIDTVARAISGDENSSEHMGLLVQCADWIRERFPGCTVLLVHHTGHGDASRARGSSAFYAALDSEALAKPLKSGDVQLHASKCKDWAPPSPLQLRRQSVPVTVPGLDKPTSTLVMEATEMESIADRIAKQNEITRLKAEGKSIRAIADETGVPRSTVARMVSDDREAGF